MKISNDDLKAVVKIMDNCVSRLMEIGCDSVQIVSTSHVDGNLWARSARGGGNLYARYGAVRSWFENQRDMEMAEELSISLSQDSDDE